MNVQILRSQDEDEVSQTKRLITSSVIAAIVVRHEMKFLSDNEVKDLLECLSLNGNPEQRICGGFEAILSHFPKMEHLG